MSLAVHPAKYLQISSSGWNMEANRASTYGVTSPRCAESKTPFSSFRVLPPTPTNPPVERPKPAPVPVGNSVSPRRTTFRSGNSSPPSTSTSHFPQSPQNPNFIGGIRGAFDAPKRPRLRRPRTAPSDMPFRPSSSSGPKQSILITPVTTIGNKRVDLDPISPRRTVQLSITSRPPPPLHSQSYSHTRRRSHSRSKSEPPSAEQLETLQEAVARDSKPKRPDLTVDGNDRNTPEPSIRERLAFFSLITSTVSSSRVYFF